MERLRELGWIEGHTIAIEYRWAEGRTDNSAEFAAEFVRLKVDLIVTYRPNRSRGKAGDICGPDRLRGGADPLGTGLVASLARPGGNITGLSIQATDQLASDLTFYARLYPISTGWPSWPMSQYPLPCWRWARFRRQHADRARSYLTRGQATGRYPSAFEAIKGHAEALYVCTDTVLFTNRVRINTLALASRLPTMLSIRDFVQAGD